MFPAITLRPLGFYPRTQTREGGLVPDYTHCVGEEKQMPARTPVDCLMEVTPGRFLARSIDNGEYRFLGLEDFEKCTLKEQIQP